VFRTGGRISNYAQALAALPTSFFFLFVRWDFGVLRPLTGLLYQPRMICDGDCGEIGGMKIGRGTRSTRRKPAPAPLCKPQIPHD
jgi:hypothetical protein